jgi:hypothetical protein
MRLFPNRRRAAATSAALLPAALVLMATRVPAAPTEPAAVTPEPIGAAYFEKNIRPVLTANCLSCHSASPGVTRGGLALDTQAGWRKGGAHGPAIVPGNPESSLLLEALSYTHDNFQMPPSGKLADSQIALVREWIARGAPDPRIDSVAGTAPRLSGLTSKARAHWAFQPVVEPTVPHPKDTTKWVHNPIDAFVLASLQGHAMRPNPPAAREVLLRRAYYDMIGQPPTVSEVRAFLADRSPASWSKVVDALLASPHYGERWGRHWLDSARYSDATGDKGAKLADYRFPYAWTYRDYVIRSLNEDKPYNQFLTEQIAADKLPGVSAGDPRLAALGFLTVGKHFDNKDDLIDERIDTVTKATMALTVSCARCHDHEFDPVPTADYYSLYGILSSTVEPAEKPEIAGSFDAAQEEDFNRKINVLVARNQEMFYTWAGERGDEFRGRAEGFMLAATKPPKSTERQDIIEKYGLPDERKGDGREVAGALRMRPTDPVLGPFARLARIPADQFAAQAPLVITQVFAQRRVSFNPLVRNALINLRPKSLAEVAHVYAGLFARTKPYVAALMRARTAGQPDPANLTPEMAQLIETPIGLPTPAEISTPELQLAYFEKSSMANGSRYRFDFPAINELRLTHAGSPGRAMVVADAEKPANAYIHIRGDRNRLGALVPRRFLEVGGGPNRPDYSNGSGRLELARDIVDARNPLTARTLVNRVWMYHFGAGFVRTPDDLGNQSEQPSNPKLLDYLASRFVKTGWSLKQLHRMILMSSTYGESSADNPAYALRDPEDRLQWRSQVRRLDFEAIRDSLVMLTGKLDPTLGGKPVNITDEPYTYRRSIYGYVDRSNLSDLMLQFDFSDPSMPNTARTSTIVPQQALFFLNSPMTVDVARQLIARPEVANAPTDAAKTQAIYLALFQRSPRPEEIQIAANFVNQADALGADSLSPAAGFSGRRTVPRRKAYLAGRAQASRNPRAPIENTGLPVTRAPLTPWELYAQALLCSNEFVYVQ